MTINTNEKLIAYRNIQRSNKVNKDLALQLSICKVKDLPCNNVGRSNVHSLQAYLQSVLGDKFISNVEDVNKNYKAIKEAEGNKPKSTFRENQRRIKALKSSHNADYQAIYSVVKKRGLSLRTKAGVSLFLAEWEKLSTPMVA